MPPPPIVIVFLFRSVPLTPMPSPAVCNLEVPLTRPGTLLQPKTPNRSRQAGGGDLVRQLRLALFRGFICVPPAQVCVVLCVLRPEEVSGTPSRGWWKDMQKKLAEI